MANQRRVRPSDTEQNDEVEVSIDDSVIAVSDDVAWVLVGDTWVDSSRIISVGPLSAIWDEEQGKQGVPEPEGGVAVQIDSAHPDTQFVQDPDDTVEEIMERIIEATTQN